MAAASLITVHLGMASSDIAGSRQKLTEAKKAIQAVIAVLDNIPTKYADMIGSVTGATGTDAFTLTCKAQLAALTTEFNALNAEAKTVNTWLVANTTEF